MPLTMNAVGALGRVAWPLLAAAFLGGCAASEIRGTLTLAVTESPVQRPVLFPSPPEIPRFSYVGDLLGEQNFVEGTTEAKSTGYRVFAWLVGLFEVNPVPIVLQRPQTGCVDEDGRIYVTDVSKRAVFVFDAKDGRLRIWDRADGNTPFESPIGVVPAPGGGVFVSDSELGIVARLDGQGRPVATLGKGTLKRPTGLARDPKRGVLYVADTHAHDIKVFSDDGRLLSVIGGPGGEEGLFNFPTHLAFAQDQLYVSDTMNSRIQVFTPDGDPVRMFGQRGLYLGNMVRPKGVGVDDEGNVYVVESYYDHLLVFNAGGDFLLPIGGTGTEAGQFYLPAGVWVDKHNRVFVSDMFNGRVAIFQFLGSRDG